MGGHERKRVEDEELSRHSWATGASLPHRYHMYKEQGECPKDITVFLKEEGADSNMPGFWEM